MSRVTSRNSKPVPVSKIPALDINEFRDEIIQRIALGERVVSLFADKSGDKNRMYAVCADDLNSTLGIVSTYLNKPEYLSLTNDIPSLHIFEREIFEEFGIVPEKHPWLKPVRYPHSVAGEKLKIEKYPFFSMEGDEVHEVAVGPVHAGVIEPGHFRFMCDGENIHHLEIQLGYQHRGVENLFLKGDFRKKTTLAESIAGDSSIAHTTAFAGVVESFSDVQISRRAMAVRGIMCELERIAMHLGDLSGVSNDIGYLSGNVILGVMRTVIINTSQSICGNRFGRGLVVPGGVYYDIEEKHANEIKKNLIDIGERTELICNAMFSDPGVLSRLEKTGIVNYETAVKIGLSGPAARASGVKCDVRANHPNGIYQYFPVYVRSMTSGDVFARSYVRYIEIQQSIDLIIEILDNFPEDSIIPVETGPFMADAMTVSMVEGWRGEVVHCALTDSSGNVSRYKIIDPSLRNWTALALSVRNNGISDFPLCNKSFDLSYCGFDL